MLFGHKMTLSWLQGADGNVLPSAAIVLVTLSWLQKPILPALPEGQLACSEAAVPDPVPLDWCQAAPMLVMFHSSAELSVGKGPHRNSHCQREVYFPVKPECTLLATDGASARQRHSWH